jgi:DhnA family fructose-bisphosphate aldolase class Ia
MKISPKVRMNRLFRNGGCLDVAVDHGVCNEPSFLNGLEDMPRVIDMLVGARPDAHQHLGHGRPHPALGLRKREKHPLLFEARG